MDFAKTVTQESRSCLGVRFTIRRLNYIQRAEREMALVEHRQQISTMWQRFHELTGSADAQDVRERAVLDAQISAVHSQHIAPAVIRAGLLRIEGLTCEGVPVTKADELLELGPEADELLQEIWAECEAASGLSERMRKNSQSPGTSDEAKAGRESNTTAPPASDTATTTAASVPCTSPA